MTQTPNWEDLGIPEADRADFLKSVKSHLEAAEAKKRDDWHCDACGAELQIGASPWCRDKHALGHGYKPFEAFDTEIEGMGKIRIDSMKRLRQVEAESMRRWLSGEKVAPTAFRQYSQNSSNRDKGVFGRGPTPEAEERQAQKHIAMMQELRRHMEANSPRRRR